MGPFVNVEDVRKFIMGDDEPLLGLLVRVEVVSMDLLLGTFLLGAGLLALSALLLRKPFTAPTGVPTGGFGWPLVGETLQFLAQPRLFVDDRVSRLSCPHISS